METKFFNMKKILCHTLYKGVIITQKNDGFYAYGHKHETLTKARFTIDIVLELSKDKTEAQ